MIALYLLFLPPLLLSGSPDDRCRCPCDRLRRRRPYPPTIELPGKQTHFPSPTYRLLVFGANARQGKETVHLVGNRTSWWDDRAGTNVTGGPDCCRSPRLISIRGNDNGRPDRKLIKCLTGSADDLSSLLACTHYLYVG